MPRSFSLRGFLFFNVFLFFLRILGVRYNVAIKKNPCFFLCFPCLCLKGKERKDREQELSGTKIASQNRSDHGGRKRARDHSAAEIAGFCASPALKKNR